ncbi:MAG: hypothetical protein HC879_00155 [Leptolyngbyaceae cyanobacterium SL_5_9]|nr:hypothetical protein [Leptolyngbyaceae cyanobacterium SL_5_9]
MHRNWISTTQLITAGLLVGLIAPSSAATHFAQPKSVTYNPPNRGAPGETQDAGSRPACPTSEIPLRRSPLLLTGEKRSPLILLSGFICPMQRVR